MASTAWTFPGTVDGSAPSHTNVWGTPDNIKADNTLYATWTSGKISSTAPGDAAQLQTYNYGFSIPADATITGIELQMQGKIAPGGSSTNPNQYTYLTDYGTTTVVGTSKDDLWTLITLTDTIYTYGSSSDLWGATLTPAIVNATNFGAVWELYDPVNVPSVEHDYMKMKVHYSEASQPPIIMMIGA